MERKEMGRNQDSIPPLTCTIPEVQPKTRFLSASAVNADGEMVHPGPFHFLKYLPKQHVKPLLGARNT